MHNTRVRVQHTQGLFTATTLQERKKLLFFGQKNRYTSEKKIVCTDTFLLRIVYGTICKKARRIQLTEEDANNSHAYPTTCNKVFRRLRVLFHVFFPFFLALIPPFDGLLPAARWAAVRMWKLFPMCPWLHPSARPTNADRLPLPLSMYCCYIRRLFAQHERDTCEFETRDEKHGFESPRAKAGACLWTKNMVFDCRKKSCNNLFWLGGYDTIIVVAGVATNSKW